MMSSLLFCEGSFIKRCLSESLRKSCSSYKMFQYSFESYCVKLIIIFTVIITLFYLSYFIVIYFSYIFFFGSIIWFICVEFFFLIFCWAFLKGDCKIQCRFNVMHGETVPMMASVFPPSTLLRSWVISSTW